MSAPRVLIIDCISPHEIERNLATEGDILRSILANRSWDAGPRVLRLVTAQSFRDIRHKASQGIRYLHVIAHANRRVLGFVDGEVSWNEVAVVLNDLVEPLVEDEKRVLCLSCCWSNKVVKKLAPLLTKYFTGIYYIDRDEVDFDESITLWSMFYLKKPLDAPHSGATLRKTINAFFNHEDPLLLFKSVREPKRRMGSRS